MNTDMTKVIPAEEILLFVEKKTGKDVKFIKNTYGNQGMLGIVERDTEVEQFVLLEVGLKPVHLKDKAGNDLSESNKLLTVMFNEDLAYGSVTEEMVQEGQFYINNMELSIEDINELLEKAM